MYCRRKQDEPVKEEIMHILSRTIIIPFTFGYIIIIWLQTLTTIDHFLS